jgi:gluconate kinase
MFVAIAIVILVVYSFHSRSTHVMLAKQLESQLKALDRQSEAMERIASALENPKR